MSVSFRPLPRGTSFKLALLNDATQRRTISLGDVTTATVCAFRHCKRSRIRDYVTSYNEIMKKVHLLIAAAFLVHAVAWLLEGASPESSFRSIETSAYALPEKCLSASMGTRVRRKYRLNFAYDVCEGGESNLKLWTQFRHLQSVLGLND